MKLNFKMELDFPCKYEELPVGLFIYTNRQRSFTELGFKSEYGDETFNANSGEYIHLSEDKTLILIPMQILATKPHKQREHKNSK